MNFRKKINGIEKNIEKTFENLAYDLSHLRDRRRLELAIRDFHGEMLSLGNFLFLTFLAGCIASLGLVQHNQTVVIGAMIITPFLEPFVGVPLAIITKHQDLFLKSLFRAFLGLVTFFGASCLIALALQYAHFNTTPEKNMFLFELPQILLAISAGIVAALALASERIHNKISGAAIAISLAPPLSMAAIYLCEGNFTTSLAALQYFGFNMFYLILVSFLVFFFFGFRKKEPSAKEMAKVTR